MIPGRRVLRLLKDATASLHLEAEHYVRILDARATIVDYTRYLRVMAGFHGPIERSFMRHAGLAAHGYKAVERRKSHLLVSDLRALGIGRWRACTRLPTTRDTPRAVGVAYVLEGSTLGARFILSRLPESIAAARGAATKFLEGYGEQTGARWRAFGGVVEAAIATPADEAAAIIGANEAFSRMIEWLAEHETRAAQPPQRSFE